MTEEEKPPLASESESESTAATEEIQENQPHPKPVTIMDIELVSLRREATEYKDKYLRLLADSENARKRLQKEKQELMKYAIEDIITEILHPIDNLENALKFAEQMSEEVKNWAIGFQMILNQFKDVLVNHGVTPVTSIGTPFDPHFHEAVEMIETLDSPEGTVVEECVRGYRIGERIIRPARVKVAKAPLQP